MLESELQKIGLTDKEARVYISALELGQSPVQKIAERAKVNRSTTYVILESLMKKGIITTYEKGKKTYYMAEPPHALKNVIRQQADDLRRKEEMLDVLMPELESVYNLLPNKPVVRFFEGKEGLMAMQEDFLDSDEKNVYGLVASDVIQNVFTEEDIVNFKKKRRTKDIQAKVIYTSNREENDPDDEHTSRKRVPSHKFPLSSDVTIYGNKVAIASLKGFLSGVIIESKSVSETMKALFELAYESADGYNNKK